MRPDASIRASSWNARRPASPFGSVIGDTYRVEKELGRGGFGVVVQARHLAIDQLVAIKVLTPCDASAWRVEGGRRC